MPVEGGARLTATSLDIGVTGMLMSGTVSIQVLKALRRAMPWILSMKSNLRVPRGTSRSQISLE